MKARHYLYLFLTLFLPLSCVLVSCSGDDDSLDAVEPTLSIVKSDLLFDSSARTGSVELKSTSPLTVSSTSAWCLPRVEGNIVYVSVEGNDSFDGRTAIITVRDADGNSLDIPVQQRGMVIEQIPESSHYVLPAGEVINYIVRHDKPITTSTDVDWIHAEVIDDTIRVVVDSNVGGWIRRGKLTYECGGHAHTLSIAQYDIQKEVEGTYLFGGDSGGTTIATRVELVMRDNQLVMRFIRNETWEDMPLSFDRGRGVITFYSGFMLYQSGTSNYDAFFLFDSSAGRLSSGNIATMTAELTHRSLDGDEFTYAFLRDGGTWSGYHPDGFLIRASRSGLVNTSIMQVTSPFLLQVGPLGLEE